MAAPGPGFWPFGSEEVPSDPDNPTTAKAWCQVAQKFTGGISNKLCALLYGDAERPMGTGPKEAMCSEEPRAPCTCDQKPCSCQKPDINYSALHSTDLLPASHGQAATLAFLQEVVDALLQYVVTSFDRSTKVIDFHYPNELMQAYNWELSEQPEALDGVLLNCKTALKYAIRTGEAIASLKEEDGFRRLTGSGFIPNTEAWEAERRGAAKKTGRKCAVII